MSDTVPFDIFGEETETRGPLLNGVNWALVAASFIFVAFRVYFRVSRRKSIWWDDGLMILSWCILLAGVAITAVDVRDGLGRHIIYLTIDKLAAIIKRGNIASTLVDIGVGLSKASFAVTLLRLSRGYARELLWFLIVGVMLVQITSGILYWAQCSVRTGGMDLCRSMPVMLWVTLVLAAISGAMTVTLTFLPWTFLWRVADKMSVKEKLGILVATTVAQVAAAAAFVKCYQIRLSMDSFDISYDSAARIIWAYTELSATIIAASIPFMHPLLGESALDLRPRSARGGEKSPAELETGQRAAGVYGERMPVEMSGGMGAYTLPAGVTQTGPEAEAEADTGHRGRRAVTRKPVPRRRDPGAHESKVVYG